MSPLRTAFVFASLVGAFAQEIEIDYDESEIDDAVSFLQNQVETQRAVNPDVIATLEVDDSDKYDLADHLNCASEKAPTEKATVESLATFAEPSTLPEPAPAAQELIQKQAETSEPPGSSFMKAALQLMTILIVLDGLRKWHLQKQDVAAKSSQCNQAQKRDTEAWVKMVNAAKRGDVPKFKEALAQNPVVTHADAWGCTPLHFAAVGGSTTIAAELLKLGAEIDAVDAIDDTPLHMAARAGGASICELLLKAGANVNPVNKEGMTPFVVAGHANQESTCHLLADSGGHVGDLTDEELPLLVISQVVRKVMAPEPTSAS